MVKNVAQSILGIHKIILLYSTVYTVHKRITYLSVIIFVLAIIEYYFGSTDLFIVLKTV